MGKCKAGFYTNNDVVTHGPLVCFGGFGQPECKHLNECLNECGFRVHITKTGKRRIKKLGGNMAAKKGDCGGTPRVGSKGDPKPGRGRGAGTGRGMGRGAGTGRGLGRGRR